MSERTLVPIFVFWAFLTIITPTLVLLSENSKRDLDLYGNSTEVADDRRMMDHRERKYPIKKTTPSTTVVAAEELAPAPARAPLVPKGANLTASRHNGSVRSNKNDHGLAQVFPRKQLKQRKLEATLARSG